jgi:hypothetical protein
MENSLVVLHLNFHEVSITHKNIVNDMKSLIYNICVQHVYSCELLILIIAIIAYSSTL